MVLCTVWYILIITIGKLKIIILKHCTEKKTAKAFVLKLWYKNDLKVDGRYVQNILSSASLCSFSFISATCSIQLTMISIHIAFECEKSISNYYLLHTYLLSFCHTFLFGLS